MNGVIAKNGFRPNHVQVQQVRSEAGLIMYHYENGEIDEAIKVLKRIAGMMIRASTAPLEGCDGCNRYVGKGKGVGAAVADLQRNFGR
jgi:hypothetical protein